MTYHKSRRERTSWEVDDCVVWLCRHMRRDAGGVIEELT